MRLPFTTTTGERWTPDDIQDLRGIRAVVTGANSGLGLHTALELARHGGDVVLACRDAKRGDEALRTILGQVPEADIRLELLDLGDLTSVRRFAAGMAGERLDLLVNNAGVMAIPRRVTIDGFEMQLGVNHLGHFALTGLLLPALADGSLSGGPPRVVTVSSFAHRRGGLNRDDLMYERGYTPFGVYSQSKLANLLFTLELQHRADAAGRRLTAVAAHPGYAATNLQAVGPQMNGSAVMAKAAGVANVVLAQSAEQGAWPILRAATDPAVRPGEYYGPAGFREMRGHPHRVGRAATAMDTDAAGWLWDRSVELTGVDYAAPEPA